MDSPLIKMFLRGYLRKREAVTYVASFCPFSDRRPQQSRLLANLRSRGAALAKARDNGLVGPVDTVVLTHRPHHLAANLVQQVIGGGCVGHFEVLAQEV